MPFGVQRSVTIGDQKEILKFPTGLHAVKSVVLDANAFAVPNPAWERYVVPAGTILALGASGVVAGQYAAYTGVSGSSGQIAGILAHDVDLAAQSTAASEPAAMFFYGCVFATTAIVGFTQHAAALVSALDCKFE
jgi:hypothetical protein